MAVNVLNSYMCVCPNMFETNTKKYEMEKLRFEVDVKERLKK